MTVSARGSVAAQLSRFGLMPADIAWVVLSHFHADHVGGLADFTGARWIASQAAYEDVRTRTGFRALVRGFVPSLLPVDFGNRATLLPAFTGQELPPFGPTHDLFGDGAALLCGLPGHARGQIGMLVHTTTGPVLLAADGCWLSRAYRENRSPHWLTGAIVDSATQVKRTVAALQTFALAHPETPIIPSHCPEAHARWVGGSVT
jgi:glyoxylase-like metal-dependent hydrolase (beta-lactamase superfamily II)